MDDEERKMLEKLLQISEQNNRLLRKMRREVLIGRYVHLLYWIIIIGISVVSYYYLKPYLGSLDTAFQTINKFKNIQLPQ